MPVAISPTAGMTHAEIDRFIRKPPTSYAEATLTALAVERVNRATRARSRVARPAVIFSTLD